MNQDNEQHNFWAMARHGWTISIVIGITVLLVRFKALAPLVWQMVVKNASVHTLGNSVHNLIPSAAIIGGCILFIYAVRTGYKRISQELINNDDFGEYRTSKSSIVLSTIGRISLGINAPILYWAAFLFILLPQLVKLPNASLRLGTTAGLAGAFIGMAVVIVLATHIGLILTKYSLRSLSKTRTIAPAINTSNTVPQQSLALYQQQNAYLQRPGQPVNAPQAGANYQPLPYSRPDSYPAPIPQATIPDSSGIPIQNEAVPNIPPYPQQPSYTPQPRYYPGPTNNDPRNQSAEEQSGTDPNSNQSQGQ